MKLALLVLAGCTKVEPTAVAREPEPPVMPGPKLIDAGVVAVDAPVHTHPRSTLDVTSVWQPQTGADVIMTPLAGPFGDLDEVCALLKKTAIECQFRAEEVELEDPAKQVLEHNEIRTYYTLPEPPPDHTLDQQRRIALRTRAGWFVTGGIEGMGGGRGSFGWSYEFVDGHMVFGYAHTKASSGKWAGTDTWGAIVCKVDPQGDARCTPIIKTAETGYSTEKREAPAGIQDVRLQCGVSFAKGSLTIGPISRDKVAEGQAYSARAAAACTKLPYAGTRPVRGVGA